MFISSKTLSFIVRCLVLAGFFQVISSTALAQDSGDEVNSEAEVETSAESSANNDNRVSIEEIVVIAEQSFFLLNSQIEYATARLYSVYNDLNDVKEFDVDCRNSDWTGTHIRTQECWPRFFDDIVAKDSQDSRQGFGEITPVRQLRRTHEVKFDALRANIIRVASENPSAADALLELGRLEKALESKKELCKEQPVFLFIFRLCN